MKTRSVALGLLLFGLGGAAHASYVGGNPLNSVDPTGTEQMMIAGGPIFGSPYVVVPSATP